MRQLLVVLLALSVLLAGCAGPGSDDGGTETGAAEQTPTNDSGAGSPTPDNDAGAEPVNPPAGQNGTNGTNGTDGNVEINESSPADGTQTDGGQGE